MSAPANFKYMTMTCGGIACVVFGVIAVGLIVVWHQYRTDYGWVLADSGDPKATHHPRLVIREFLDPILPDEDGIYRFEYWENNIMRECFSFSSDSVRAESARIEMGENGSYSAWLKYWGNDHKIAVWQGCWLKPQ